jgi:hypothetical protein
MFISICTIYLNLSIYLNLPIYLKLSGDRGGVTARIKGKIVIECVLYPHRMCSLHQAEESQRISLARPLTGISEGKTKLPRSSPGFGLRA